jgi:SprT-like family
MPRQSQSELFDSDALGARLFALGLRGVARVEAHENRSVMVSVTPKHVLRVHRGYAYAPESVLAAIVAFVDPGTRRAIRAAMEKRILSFPVHAFVPPRSPRPRRRGRPVPKEDRPLIQELEARHLRLSRAHFDARLPAIPIRISHRMRRRLGELTLDPVTDRPVEITISYRHICRDGWDEVEHTLLHEMIHQWQAHTGRPVDHGPEFRRKARTVGVVPRAMREILPRRHRSHKGLE